MPRLPESQVGVKETRMYRQLPTSGDEQDLITRARLRDGTAVEALIRRFQDRVFSLALRLTRHRAEAEDVTQEVFVRALQGLSTFRGDAAFFTWLYRITVNLVRDRVRARAGEPGARPAEEPGIDPPDPGPTPDRTAAGREGLRRLERALARLNPVFREAFLLRHVEGLSYDEMVEVLEIPSATLKMRVHRACVALRALVEESDAERA